jgi:hypothetical protein
MGNISFRVPLIEQLVQQVLGNLKEVLGEIGITI